MPYNVIVVDDVADQPAGLENEFAGSRESPVCDCPKSSNSSQPEVEVIYSDDGTKTFQKLTFEEAAREEAEMYRAMTPQQRLELQAQLIMMHYGPNPPRLARVFEIIKLPRG